MNCRYCQTKLYQNTDLCIVCESLIQDDREFQNAWHLLAVISSILIAILIMALGEL
jgi:hypothetical protein